MSTLLRKEIRLSSMLLTWLFIGFGAMTMIPGYPILCGVFFHYPRDLSKLPECKGSK